HRAVPEGDVDHLDRPRDRTPGPCGQQGPGDRSGVVEEDLPDERRRPTGPHGRPRLDGPGARSPGARRQDRHDSHRRRVHSSGAAGHRAQRGRGRHQQGRPVGDPCRHRRAPAHACGHRDPAVQRTEDGRVSTSGARLQLHRRRAYRYLMPLKRPYGTARALITESTNFIVHLYGNHNGSAVVGVGESQRRHELSGDGAPDNHYRWAFLHSALAALVGTQLGLTTRTTAVDGVRAVMGDLDRLAHREAEEVHGPKPFRGTLLGVEVALLDLAARAMGLRISQLLTERRSRARISIATSSTPATLPEIGDRAARQKRFPITRLKGDGSLEHNLALLRAAATGNAAAGRPKPLWIDINEAMDLDAASEFVRAAAAQMAAGELPAELIVEGPLPQEDGVQHADLQRVADQAVADLEAEQDLRLQIMADENIWDAGDLDALHAHGGCRAINIKAPKAGGLLPSLDLAEAAVAADPQMRLCIGGMLGTSEITAWALHNLGKSMPRIDYMTTVPPRNVAAALAAPPSRYSAPGSNLIALQHEPGLGTALLPEVLAPFVQDEHDLDDPGAPPTAGPAAARPGLELAELPDILDGRWLTAPQPG